MHGTWRRSVVAVVAGALAGGCGYRFVARGGGLPEGVGQLCAPVLVNRTAEPGLEAIFTQELREQLVRAGTLGASGHCDAVIEGEILSVGSEPNIATEEVLANEATGTPGRPRQTASYRATVAAVLRLKKDGQVLTEAQVSSFDDFLPGPDGQGDVLESEASRSAALRRLAATLMREGYDRLATRWE